MVYYYCQGEEKRLKVLFSIPATLLPSGNTQASNGCTQLGKTFSKKIEKPLDKLYKVCYNNNTGWVGVREQPTSNALRLPQIMVSAHPPSCKKNQKKVLTNQKICDILLLSRGARDTHRPNEKIAVTVMMGLSNFFKNF